MTSPELGTCVADWIAQPSVRRALEVRSAPADKTAQPMVAEKASSEIRGIFIFMRPEDCFRSGATGTLEKWCALQGSNQLTVYSHPCSYMCLVMVDYTS